jgi:hypothetical protein
MERFDVWSQSRGPGKRTAAEDAEIKKKIRRDVLEELKSRHETAPKYRFSPAAGVEFIAENGGGPGVSLRKRLTNKDNR